MYISSPVRMRLLLLSFCVRYFPIKGPGYDHSILLVPHSGRGRFWEELSAASDKLTAGPVHPNYILYWPFPQLIIYHVQSYFHSHIAAPPNHYKDSKHSNHEKHYARRFRYHSNVLPPILGCMCRPESNPSPPIHTGQWNVRRCNKYLYH